MATKEITKKTTRYRLGNNGGVSVFTLEGGKHFLMRSQKGTISTLITSERMIEHSEPIYFGCSTQSFL